MSAPRISIVNPATDRDLLLCAFLGGACALVTALSAALMAGAALTNLLVGWPLAIPSLNTWPRIVTRLLTDPAHPAAAFGPPWAGALAEHPATYWFVTSAMVITAIGCATVAISAGWRVWGPTPAGHASRAQIRQELSADAARRTAVWTRPSLSTSERRTAPVTDLAAPLHRGPIGRLWVPFENPTGTIAPTQSGKTRRDLAHKAIDAPGALLCSTTKADLLELASLARTRRAGGGPVLVYDTTGAITWPAQLRWSPTTGCADPATAYRRARAMVEAAAVTVEAGGSAGSAGNDRVFRERATMVLSAYLLAAAITGHSMTSVVRWATDKAFVLEPVALLHDYYPALSANLRAETEMVARTADAVWMSVRRVIEPLLNPTLLELCLPEPGHGFDANVFIQQRGSLFLIAGQHQAAQVAPLLTALADHWLTTAQDLALTYRTRRLDPPATAVLDELPNATPLPELPDVISDSAGRGVLIHWAAQSLAQLEDTFGPARARQLLDNTTTLTAWGALKDARALEWLSTLAGHHERARWQHHNDSFMGGGRSSVGTETVPTYRPGDIRALPRGQVLVVHRHLPPIRARTIDITQRPDWPQLRTDVDAVRTGQTPVTPDGRALTAEPSPHPAARSPL